MYEYIPDYTEQHAMYEAAQERRNERLPKCDCCGERILGDFFFNIEGVYYCEDCINDYKTDIDEYMEE